MTLLRLAFLLLLLVGQPVLSSQETVTELEEAKTLYQQGRFGLAVARLQTVVVKLQSQEDLRSNAIRKEALFYLGLTYVALDDPVAAVDSFEALLRLEPERELDPEVYAPKIIELFERARQEVASGKSPPQPETEKPATTTRTSSIPDDSAPAKSGGTPGAAWALVGAGAGAGGMAIINSLTNSTTTTSTSTTTSTTTTSVPPQTVEVDLRVNGVKQGTFSCSQPLVFTIDVVNSTGNVIHVEGFDLNMISLTTPACATHRPPVDGLVDRDLLPGGRVQIRQIDLTGDLCREPDRVPGCQWRSVVHVVTSDGDFQDDIEFITAAQTP